MQFCHISSTNIWLVVAHSLRFRCLHFIILFSLQSVSAASHHIYIISALHIRESTANLSARYRSVLSSNVPGSSGRTVSGRVDRWNFPGWPSVCLSSDGVYSSRQAALWRGTLWRHTSSVSHTRLPGYRSTANFSIVIGLYKRTHTHIVRSALHHGDRLVFSISCSSSISSISSSSSAFTGCQSTRCAIESIGFARDDLLNTQTTMVSRSSAINYYHCLMWILT